MLLILKRLLSTALRRVGMAEPLSETPEKDLDPVLTKMARHNSMKNRSKRSPEWIFFADAGAWQTANGDESKFRIANCLYCLKDNIQTKIRGKIETMKNHIMDCERIPASQKDVYERHPSRYRKRASVGENTDTAKRRKSIDMLDTPPLLDGLTNRAVVLHGAGDIRVDHIPLPAVRPGHVLIAMRSVSIRQSVSSSSLFPSIQDKYTNILSNIDKHMYLCICLHKVSKFALLGVSRSNSFSQFICVCLC